MTKEEVNTIILENKKRRDVLFSPYDPITGVGSPLKRINTNYLSLGERWECAIPIVMYEENKELIDLLNIMGSVEGLLKYSDQPSNVDAVTAFQKGFAELRFKHDFEFWAYTCAKIQDKETKQPIPFKLNRAQRKLLAVIEGMRLARIAIRIILLKARQWGGSTFVQVYMSWLQIILKTNWHSVIVADVEDQARNIRGMYSRLAKEYPASMGKIEFVPYEGSTKNRMIVGRNCIVGVGSAQKPDSLRSFDFAMTHLSEVGLFKSTPQKSAEDLVQSIRSTVPDVPDSLAILESTAKGVGNFFHREWQAAVDGTTVYKPVFVGWHEIERYQKKIGDFGKFIQWVRSDDYALFLWNLGATLEGIKWYFDTKRGDNYDDWRMKSEYPSTCIAEGVRVGTNKGIIPMEQCQDVRETNSGTVVKFIPNGEKEVFKLITKWGYEIECTSDHRIKIQSDEGEIWKMLEDIKIDDRVILTCPKFSDDIYTLEWNETFVNYRITITPEFGRFLGIYMGDGSYSGQVLSIACDARDVDFIADTEKLVKNLFDLTLNKRIIGKNKGCAELRARDGSITKYFLKLGIIKQRDSDQCYIRNVCVPEIIFRSPKDVIREFLKGIFETDGFNGYDVPKIGLFSKHVDFLKDIQLLLLGFGITSKLHQRPTVNGKGYKYIANTLTLEGEQADLYRNYIGFLSNRKKSRFKSWKVRNFVKRTKNILSDSVVSINTVGVKNVYDLTIQDTHCFDANGILVHNCEEAFQSTGRRVFAPAYVQAARKNCYKPEFYGDIYAKSQKGKAAFENIEFQPDDKGLLLIWSKPDKTIDVTYRYVTIVDIGGRTVTADWSVIKVFDRYWMMEGGKPEVVACWRNHLDQDLVAWKAAQIAKYYNNSLLVIESNSLDTESIEGSEGLHFLTVLDEIVKYYPNIYARSDPERVRQGLPVKYGFQTNKSTKPMVIDELNGVLREEAYYERDLRATDEMDTYEVKPNGTYGATEGCNDDLVMVTAIGVWVCFKYLAIPKLLLKNKTKFSKNIVSEASI